jgi:hypothetical protein|tara:strand:+ start:1035 stop:1163 length:129 start_codon:yes stop_codon:yes gene_type:complete
MECLAAISDDHPFVYGKDKYYYAIAIEVLENEIEFNYKQITQ